ncbi:tRNA-binding protein [Fulvitalea axinellae]|uniref:tRNA-binding protein n=1 Tax=Fulvitalea axinellae TaxID=1182444 RepID=A0AAU9D7H6_9BACT|nr:tRNA-binding protein [Fulvitalea axinellae]
MERDQTLSWADFEKVDIRVGTVLEAEEFKEARRSAYKMKVDFGELGILKTSAQITDIYKPEDLPGTQVVAVVNFPPKQIANIMSECLVLGAVDAGGKVVLLRPDKEVENGLRVS